MRYLSMTLAAAASLALIGAAAAEPVKLSKAQMASITAGAITTTITVTTTQFNGGGNTPSGNANGVPIVTTITSISKNPAGSAPPGQNK